MDPRTVQEAREFLARALVAVGVWWAVLVLCGLLHGCSSAREKALQTTLQGVTVSRDIVVEYSRTFQAQIVENGQKLGLPAGEIESALKAFRESRDRVLMYMAEAFAAVAAAAVDTGPETLVEAVKAAENFRRAIYRLRRGELVE